MKGPDLVVLCSHRLQLSPNTEPASCPHITSTTKALVRNVWWCSDGSTEGLRQSKKLCYAPTQSGSNLPSACRIKSTADTATVSRR